MRVDQVRIVEVAGSPDRVRLEATVRFDTGRPDVEDVWFEAPAAMREALDESGNPWVAALLPLAATLGEPLRTSLPVDAPLLSGAREVLRTWRSWYGTTHVVPVEAPVRPRPAAPPPRRTLAFFSLGVDSFFTALGGRDGDREVARGTIDDLVHVSGYDLRLRHEAGIARVASDAREAARALGRPLVAVGTNLRSTRWREANWPLVSHGAGLASVALALGRRYDLALVPGSVWAMDLVPWGSHPLTDEWLSSWDLRVRHDGNETERFDKVEAIASLPVVRRLLHVCCESRDGANCGACVKCLLTMAMLDACGALADATTLPGREDYLARLRRVEARFPSDRRHLTRVLVAAQRRGLAGLASAAEEVLARPAGHARMRLPPRRAKSGLGRLLRRRARPSDDSPPTCPQA